MELIIENEIPIWKHLKATNKSFEYLRGHKFFTDKMRFYIIGGMNYSTYQLSAEIKLFNTLSGEYSYV